MKRRLNNYFKMPRIDPQQLLKTLGVLLAPHGGIKSSEEVVRLVQLMQKFSRKLVSKCIYIRILKATPHELLEQFLCERGWELLNQWFSDAIKTQNWSLAREMIQLFNMCPISAARLKENVEDNHAPKLINQLRQEMSVDEDIKALASDVYMKWVRIVSPAVSAQSGTSTIRGKGRELGTIRGKGVTKQLSDAMVDSDDSDISSESDTSNAKDGSRSAGKDGTISLLQSLADEVSENIKKEGKVSVNKEDKKAVKTSSKSEVGKASRTPDDKHKDKSKGHHTHSSSHGSSHDKDKKKDTGSSKRDVSSKHSSRDRDKDREQRRYRHTDPRDEVNAQEKQRIKEMARKLKEEAQAKKDKETLNKVGGVSSSTSSLSKIPKIPKKAVKEEDKKKGSSFSDMLGHLDVKPTTVRKPLLKNKTAAMLESMTKASNTSQKSNKDTAIKSSSSSVKKDSNSKEKDTSNRRDSHSAISPNITNKKDSPPGNKKPITSGESRRLSLSISDANKNKKSPEKESPKSGNKSPSIKSSSGFMDAIFNTMKKEEPRKRKRRLSDREESKSLAAEKKNGEKDPSPDKKLKEEDENGEKKEEDSAPIQAFSFYRELDTNDTNGDQLKVKIEGANKISPNSSPSQRNGENTQNAAVEEPDNDENKDPENECRLQDADDNVIPFDELTDSEPREVKGILVYHRGKDKLNKTIKWKAEAALVSIKYFEMDEDERVNVNKVKFANMREFETKMEKAALGLKSDINVDEQEIANWYKPVPLTFDENSDQKPCFTAYGSQSMERNTQAEREKTVLQALYFNLETTPNTPAEPDNPTDSMKGSLNEVKLIPLEDKEADEGSYHDYTQEGWPDPKMNKLEHQYAASISSAFSLPPALSSLLATIETEGLENIIPSPGSLSKEDQSTLAAQTAALQKLGMIPGVDLDPTFPPPIQSLPTKNANGNAMALENPQVQKTHHMPVQKQPPLGLDPFGVPGFPPPPVHNIPPNMNQQPPFGMAVPDHHMSDNGFNNFNQNPMQTPFHPNGPFQGGMTNHRGNLHFGRGGTHNGFRGGGNGTENFNRDR